MLLLTMTFSSMFLYRTIFIINAQVMCYYGRLGPHVQAIDP